ncbi:MAG: DUF3187 family protein [Holophaga sp.]|nr:DUF3187 family protein [Holophaga sp.]
MASFRSLVLFTAALAACAQETPHPNRLAWLSIFPEPLPEGVNQLGLEVSNQFLRPDRTVSPDNRSHAQLMGEDWELVSDLATGLGPGRINLRTRVDHRSSGIADRLIMNWHNIIGVGQGGRDQTPPFQDKWQLVRDGVVVFDSTRPRTIIQGLDVSYAVPFGDGDNGGRYGGSVQLPTGGERIMQSSGGTNFMAGAAVWHTFRFGRLWAQGEEIYIQLPKGSPLRAVIDRGQFWRAWAGIDLGRWRGFNLDVSLAYNETPYFTKLVRLDKYGLQQTWVLRHVRCPHWRFGFTEKAGTFATPEITGFSTYRF